MDDYQAACERKARQYAALRAEGLYNDEDVHVRSSGNSHGSTLPLTDAQLDRRIDNRIANAIRELAPQIDRALDNLADAANKALDILEEEFTRERDKNAELREEVAALRVDRTITRSIIASRNVVPINRDDGVVRKDSKSDTDLENEAAVLAEAKRNVG